MNNDDFSDGVRQPETHGLRIVTFMPVFPQLTKPLGFLCGDHLECQALFFYYIHARRSYERNILEGGPAYEGDLSDITNFRNLYLSVMQSYGVRPEIASKHWSCVDMQCATLRTPKLPDEDRYRHNHTPAVWLDS